MVYFDRHRMDCGGSGSVLKMFRLRRRGGRIGFEYRCCRLRKTVCYNSRRTNGFSSDGGGNAVYLDRRYLVVLMVISTVTGLKGMAGTTRYDTAITVAI